MVVTCQYLAQYSSPAASRCLTHDDICDNAVLRCSARTETMPIFCYIDAGPALSFAYNSSQPNKYGPL